MVASERGIGDRDISVTRKRGYDVRGMYGKEGRREGEVRSVSVDEGIVGRY